MSGSFRRSSRISVNDFSSMDRTEVTELHYLAPIANVRSIMERGLLSHHRASRLSRIDISMQEVQDTRAKKHVPGGLSLHDYVNLYFNGRNKMMAKRRPLHDRICVLRGEQLRWKSRGELLPIKTHLQNTPSLWPHRRA
jgi:hypothetical protein